MRLSWRFARDGRSCKKDGWKPGAGIAAALLLGLSLEGPLGAGEAQDRLFATGVLEPVPTGQRLIFGHARGGTFDSTRLSPIVAGEMAVTLAETASGTGGREARATARDGPRERLLLTVPVTAGHPLLLIFLESTVRDIAALTGGSPFYIRNRIREALAADDRVEPVEVRVAGGRAAGELLVFRPFTDDPNRSKLGDLAELEIRVLLSDAVPGGIVRLEATAAPDASAAPAFFETIVFERVEGG